MDSETQAALERLLELMERLDVPRATRIRRIEQFLAECGYRG